MQVEVQEYLPCIHQLEEWDWGASSIRLLHTIIFFGPCNNGHTFIMIIKAQFPAKCSKQIVKDYIYSLPRCSSYPFILILRLHENNLIKISSWIISKHKINSMKDQMFSMIKSSCPPKFRIHHPYTLGFSRARKRIFVKLVIANKLVNHEGNFILFLLLDLQCK